MLLAVDGFVVDVEPPELLARRRVSNVVGGSPERSGAVARSTSAVCASRGGSCGKFSFSQRRTSVAASSPRRLSRLALPVSKPWLPPVITTAEASISSRRNASTNAFCWSTIRFQSRLPVMNSAGPSTSSALASASALSHRSRTAAFELSSLAAVVLRGVLHRAVVGVVEADEPIDRVGDVGPQLGAGEPIVVRRRVRNGSNAGAGGHALHHDVPPLMPMAWAVPRRYCTAALMFCSGHGNTGPDEPAFEQVVVREEDDVALGDEPIGPRSHALEAAADPAAAVHDHDRHVALIRRGSAQLAALRFARRRGV